MAQRIVSDNPCIDALLAELVDPGRVVAISAYSHNPGAASAPIAWARRFPATDGSAEGVIALRADLFLTGGYGPAPSRQAIAAAGIPVVQVPAPLSIQDARTQVMTVARAVGAVPRGQALVAQIDAALAHARRSGARRSGTPPTALIWLRGGMGPGAGTLSHDLLTAAGLDDAAPALGRGAWGRVDIEALALKPPSVLLAPSPTLTGQRAALVRHLKPRMQIIDYPERLTFCGGRTILAALDHMGRARFPQGGAR